MTKKDYIKFAAMLNTHIDNTQKSIGLSTTHDVLEYHTARLTEVEAIVRDVADIFQDDNPRFDRDRFLQACGIKS